MKLNSRHIRYYPPKPIANNIGRNSVVITITPAEWATLDAMAKHQDLSRAELARRILKEGLK